MNDHETKATQRVGVDFQLPLWGIMCAAGSVVGSDDFFEGTYASTASAGAGISINNTGSSGTNANMPPYIGKLKIIKVL